MYFGTPTLCFKAKDLEASRRFQEALGLFTFLEESWLNLRGGDVATMHAALRARGASLEGALQRYRPGEHGSDVAGECWFTRDPAGNAVFFDTNERESGAEARRRQVTQLLRDTEQELIRLGADAECLASFRREILEKYAGSM